MGTNDQMAAGRATSKPPGTSPALEPLETRLLLDADLTWAADATLQLGSEQHLTAGGADIQVAAYSVPVLADWNADGRPDLLVGEKSDTTSGKVRVYLNTGTAAAPVYAPFFRVQAAGSDLQVPSGRSSVDVYDFNGDGRKDLVVGNTDAQVVFYANQGTNAAPAFGNHEILVAVAGDSRSRLHVADFDADGIPDVLVGDTDGLVRCFLGEEASDDEGIGYATVFENVSTVPNRRAVPVVAGGTGTLKSMSIYHQGGSGHVILAIYSDASGLPGTLLGVTASTVIDSTEGWQTIALQSPVAVSAGQTIWLAWVFENDPGMRWTEGLPGRAMSPTGWSGGMPQSFGTATTTTGFYSIYATYGASSETPGEVIVDNIDGRASSTGVWYASSRPGPYGTDSMATTGAGSTFTFSADLTPGVAYAVYSWWTSGPPRYTTVPCEIRSGSTLLDTVVVNQTLNGSQWNLLGTYSFTGAASVVIRSAPSSAYSTNADAVRFVPVA